MLFVARLEVVVTAALGTALTGLVKVFPFVSFVSVMEDLTSLNRDLVSG